MRGAASSRAEPSFSPPPPGRVCLVGNTGWMALDDDFDLGPWPTSPDFSGFSLAAAATSATASATVAQVGQAPTLRPDLGYDWTPPYAYAPEPLGEVFALVVVVLAVVAWRSIRRNVSKVVSLASVASPRRPSPASRGP